MIHREVLAQITKGWFIEKQSFRALRMIHWEVLAQSTKGWFINMQRFRALRMVHWMAVVQSTDGSLGGIGSEHLRMVH